MTIQLNLKSRGNFGHRLEDIFTCYELLYKQFENGKEEHILILIFWKYEFARCSKGIVLCSAQKQLEPQHRILWSFQLILFAARF